MAVLALSLQGMQSLAQQAPANNSWPHSAAAITDFRVNDPMMMAARSALLDRAEAQLARGEVVEATDTFERAAMMLHAPDTEMGLVRAYMQAGQYRRALSFCAHVSGAHLESGAAGALYAWLLSAGGQRQFATRVLTETRERLPGDPVGLEVARAFASAAPVATGLLVQSPQRMAPQAVSERGAPTLPNSVRVVSSGVLVANGTMALVPSTAVEPASSEAVRVRNGMGLITQAHADVAQPLASRGVTVLRLDVALPVEGIPAVAPRDPFAGSASFAFAYAAQESAQPAWPWLSQGFFGSFLGRDGYRKLGIGIVGSYGGPVLDAAGRLAGMVLEGRGEEPAMLSASHWLDFFPVSAPAVVSASSSVGAAERQIGAIPADEAYEYGMRIALQVLMPR